MRLAANTRLVRNRVRLAAIFHFASLISFGLGFIISLQIPELWVYPYLAILVGLLLYQVAQANLRRWGPRHRVDGEFARSLKGLDDRYTLVAFASSSLPDYVLIGPSGLTALIPRANGGTVVCRGDRWSLEGGRRWLSFLRAPLGNPTGDARTAVSALRRQLDEAGVSAEEVPIGAVIVMVNPRARLRIEGCSFPVTTTKELRNHLRRVKGNLSPNRLAELRETLVQFERG